MTTKEPRGLRNQNPGNIRRGDRWQGMAEEQSDPEFVTFTAPRFGIRAIARVLISYQDRHKLNTVAGIIGRWAPPNENDTRAYVRSVADKLGVAPNEKVDVYQYPVMRALVEAIIRHENGKQPYDKGTIDAGLKLAGIEPPMKPLPVTRTMTGTALTGSAQAVQYANEQIQPFGELHESVRWICLALTVAGLGLVAYARWDDRRKGVH